MVVLNLLLAVALVLGIAGWVVHASPVGGVQPKWFGICRDR